MNRKLFGIIAILVVVALAVPAVFNYAHASSNANRTVMVYMAADNNLNDYAYKDLNEMMNVGSQNGINIVVFVDYSNDGAYYYYINHGSYTTLKSLGEVNTGDYNTLRSFVSRAVSNYPANHYALIIRDHGGARMGAARDDTNNGDHLTLDEIVSAISGYHFDLLGFDACLMGTIEVYRTLAPYADVLVLSEQTEPGYGRPYDDVLGYLVNNPSTTAADRAKNIVDYYYNRYQNAGISGVTLGAFDTAYANELKQKLDDFVYDVANNRGTYRYYKDRIRYYTTDFFYDLQADLMLYVYLSGYFVSEVSDTANAIIDLYFNHILINFKTDIKYAYGMSIFYPSDYRDYNNLADQYNSLQRSQNTVRDDLLYYLENY